MRFNAKMNVKRIVKKIAGCREGETIRDSMYRHKLDLERHFFRQKFTNRDFIRFLKESGIRKDDSIMLHCGYKAFFNYEGSPNDVVDDFIGIIGREGNLAMPCFGKNRFFFDVDNDKSAAGVVSECFRHKNGAIRSRGAHFSCAAFGKDKIKITKDHEKSVYGFDENSPYYKFVQLNNSKIVMIGLGKKSVKLSLYHLPEMLLLESDDFYRSLFNKKCKITVTYKQNGEQKNIVHDNMLLRDDTVPNVKEINKLYKQNFVSHNKISNLDIVIIDAKRALDYLLEECNNGHYMIKRKRF